MQAILHGIQKVDFVNDQGERIQGTKLFLSYRDEKVVGQKTDKLFLKAGYQLPQGLATGAVLDMSFDISKHLDKIQVVSPPATK